MPETSDRPTGPGRRRLQRGCLRQKQSRRLQLARRNDPSALFECTGCGPLASDKVTVHRNAAPQNGTSRRRNRGSPARSVAPPGSMAMPSLLAETERNIQPSPEAETRQTGSAVRAAAVDTLPCNTRGKCSISGDRSKTERLNRSKADRAGSIPDSNI